MIGASNAPIQRMGANYAEGEPTAPGSITLVSAGANTTGLIIRSALVFGGAGLACYLRINSRRLFGASSSIFVNYQGPGILVPPGQALTLDWTGSSGILYAVSWDVIS